MFKQLKNINELDSYFADVEELQDKNLELTDELKEVRDELEKLKSNYGRKMTCTG